MKDFGIKWKTVWVSALAIFFSHASIAGVREGTVDQSEKKGFLYGAGVIVSQEPYRGYDTQSSLCLFWVIGARG
jgi:hypothetical protein